MICLIAQRMLTLILLGTIVASDCRVMSDMSMIYCGAGQMKILILPIRVGRKFLTSTSSIDHVVTRQPCRANVHTVAPGDTLRLFTRVS